MKTKLRNRCNSGRILSHHLPSNSQRNTPLLLYTMSIADQVQDLMEDVLGPERSPKRRRLSSDSPQSSEENDNKPDTEPATDAENGYAFEDESDGAERALDSNSQTPRDRDQTTDSRPAGIHYKPYMTLKGHKRGVAAVRFSPNGKWIASCCEPSDTYKTHNEPN